MNVKIIETRGCTHRPNLERELRNLGVEYEVLFVEDVPEVLQQYNIRHSPNLVVDGQVVHRAQPTAEDLRKYLALD